MNEKSSSSSSGGIGFCGLLAILFIALKLTHVIAWSWWWVLAPLWVGVAIVLVIFAFAGACLLLAAILETPKRKA